MMFSSSISPPLQQLKGCRRDESPYDGAHYHLVYAVQPALDTALANEQGHEKHDHGDKPSVGAHATLYGDEAGRDPPGEGDGGVSRWHSAREGVRGVRQGLAEKHDEHDDPE